MKKMIVWVAALVMLIAGTQIAPAPAAAQPTGNELIEYLGPNPVPYFGCGEFETKIPFHFSGLNTNMEYLITVSFGGYETASGTGHTWHLLSVFDTPGSAEFDFWAVAFDARPYNTLPGVYQAGGESFPILPLAQLGNSQVLIELQTADFTTLDVITLLGFDCTDGSFESVRKE